MSMEPLAWHFLNLIIILHLRHPLLKLPGRTFVTFTAAKPLLLSMQPTAFLIALFLKPIYWGTFLIIQLHEFGCKYTSMTITTIYAIIYNHHFQKFSPIFIVIIIIIIIKCYLINNGNIVEWNVHVQINFPRSLSGIQKL